tara:strand:+ start:4880 stop:5095 length:216 start_codon:yes stop_codon:yes gene_type:complete
MTWHIECSAMSLSHIGKGAKMNKTKQNKWKENKAEFIDFLEATLIPDLEASGMDATAEDFKTAVYFMRGKQ